MVAFKTSGRATALPAPRHPLAIEAARGRLRPALLALALLLSGSGLAAGAQARGWSGADADPAAEAAGPPPAREGQRWQRAQAWLRLSGPQRSRFFADLRALESREARSRLDLLSEAERCLDQARAVEAVQACQERQHGRRRSLKQAHQGELAMLMKRYGLPLPPVRRLGMGWRHGRSGGPDEGQGGPQTPLPR